MKAIITGVAGFIGSTLAERLLREGWDVTGVDSLTDYYDPTLKRANLSRISSSDHGRFRFIEGDLLALDKNELLEGAEVVFHQAGQPGVRKSWGSDFATYIDHNIAVTQGLLEAAKSTSSLSRFVYASSSSVYGDAERYPTLETDAPRPRSPYGVSKLAAEHLCSLYAANFAVPTTSLRYFTVFGPGQRPDMAFTRFLKAARDSTPITLYGTGAQVRDFTFVSDIVDANFRAATTDTRGGEIFNVCGGSNISVNGVLDLIREISGNELTIDRQPAVAGDVTRTGGDNSKIRNALGWEAQVSVREGLRKQWEWITGGAVETTAS